MLEEVGVTAHSLTHGLLLQTAVSACLQDGIGASGGRKRDLVPWGQGQNYPCGWHLRGKLNRERL